MENTSFEDAALLLLPLYERTRVTEPTENVSDGSKCCPSAFGRMDEQDLRPDSQLNSALKRGDHGTQDLPVSHDQLYLAALLAG